LARLGKPTGRKRRLVVDVLGLLLKVVVTAASVPEREGAKQLLAAFAQGFAELVLIWADAGYSGPAFADWVLAHYGWLVEIALGHRLCGLATPVGGRTHL
jgi:transposase